MDNLDPKRRRILEKLAKVVDQGNLGVFEYLVELESGMEERMAELKTDFEKRVQEIRSTFPDISSALESIKGKDGEDGEDGADSEIPGPKGDKGDKGEQGEAGKDGKDGVDGTNGTDGRDGVDGKDGSPDTPTQVKEKLLEVGLEIADINELDATLSQLDKRISSIPMNRGGGRKTTYVKRYNLTSQLNGVTKTFSLPNDTIEVLGVWGTQFPINFNPGTDWTFAGRTLTLTSEVAAPESGQTLYCLIEALFYG